MQQSLDGIRIVDMTQALAGPYCCMLLGDLGADVIKVEPPGRGDMSRRWVPPTLGGESVYFMGTNRNKRGVTLNWKDERGAALLREIVATADIFVVNVPTLDKLAGTGVDWDTLRETQPALIYAAISGYGHTGPRVGGIGYDIVTQGEAGAMSFTGEPGTPPTRFPTAMADMTTGLYTAIGILAALVARQRTGKGQLIDVALLDSQVTWLAYGAWNYFATGEEPQKLGTGHPSIVPYQSFPTADGWLIVAVGTDEQWFRFATLIGLDEATARDPRFATNAARFENRAELVPEVARRLRERPARAWLPLLAEANVPAGPVNDVPGILSDEQLIARGMIVELEHPAAGLVRTLGNPVHLSHTPPTYRRPPPMLGEHNCEVWGSLLGHPEDYIARLSEEGVL